MELKKGYSFEEEKRLNNRGGKTTDKAVSAHWETPNCPNTPKKFIFFQKYSKNSKESSARIMAISQMALAGREDYGFQAEHFCCPLRELHAGHGVGLNRYYGFGVTVLP
jgi:hypothetical protein